MSSILLRRLPLVNITENLPPKGIDRLSAFVENTGMDSLEQTSNTLASLQWPNKSDARRTVSRALIAAVKSESESESSLLIAAADATDASPRECDCPEWVIRCAHIDDLVIAVGDAVLFRMQEEFFHIGKRYALIDPRRAVNTRDAVGYLYTDAPGLHQTFDSEAEALAAFRAAEAELLGRAL